MELLLKNMLITDTSTYDLPIGGHNNICVPWINQRTAMSHSMWLNLRFLHPMTWEPERIKCGRFCWNGRHTIFHSRMSWGWGPSLSGRDDLNCTEWWLYFASNQTWGHQWDRLSPGLHTWTSRPITWSIWALLPTIPRLVLTRMIWGSLNHWSLVQTLIYLQTEANINIRLDISDTPFESHGSNRINLSFSANCNQNCQMLFMSWLHLGDDPSFEPAEETCPHDSPMALKWTRWTPAFLISAPQSCSSYAID